jgi:MoaA/NifB/PqqE/SkfB family radical SAM enzyme
MTGPQSLATRCRGCGASQEIVLPPFAGVASAPCPGCGAVNYVSLYKRIDIGLSEVCNLSCVMCRRPQEKEFMARDAVLRCLRQAAQIGVQTVSFSGGEPFVHPDFRDILGAALGLGVAVELVTNGTLIRPEDIPTLERLKCVTVSIDGPRAEHDHIRGRAGAWDLTMHSLELLAASRATWGTNTVMQRDNAGVLYATWREIRKRGRPRYVAFTHVEVVPETRHLQMAPAQAEAARQQVARVADECRREWIHLNDQQLVGEFFQVFADKTHRFRPVQGCPIPRTFLGVSNYGYFPCWHQGRHLEAPSLIEALESPLCADIIREGLERRCVGCNAANYSWSEDWVGGVLEAHRRGDYQRGVVHLSEEERQAGSVRPGKRTLPLLERGDEPAGPRARPPAPPSDRRPAAVPGGPPGTLLWTFPGARSRPASRSRCAASRNRS